jgi:hypothetical protein
VLLKVGFKILKFGEAEGKSENNFARHSLKNFTPCIPNSILKRTLNEYDTISEKSRNMFF